jgi:hypothetical protein
MSTPEISVRVENGREELVKRWLRLVVERSSLQELSRRPLGERVRELELLLEAAGEAGLIPAPVGDRSLEEEVTSCVERFARAGQPFALALIGGGADLAGAVAEAAGADELVLDAGGGATAILLERRGGADARAALDRMRVTAWRRLGGRGRLVDVGIATCPEDGVSAEQLIALARERLRQAVGGEHSPPTGSAAVTPLYPSS